MADGHVDTQTGAGETPVPVAPLRIALAGIGFWGSKLARNIQDSRGCELVAILDADAARREQASERYPRARVESQLERILRADDIDAIVLATPAGDHANQAAAALAAGKHVLVEKPLALSVLDCDRLAALAGREQRVLMVGHTFLYSEPVRVLRQLICDGVLGRVLYVYGQRLNLGGFRDDVSVLWDLGPHDVSILRHLITAAPVRVSARTYGLAGTSADVAFMTIEFADGTVGHVHDSRLDPRKVRQLVVVGDRKMAVYDDTDNESPIRIYDKGVERSEGPDEGSFGEFRLEVRTGDMLAPKISSREPLASEVAHFVECARTGANPLTDAANGRAVVAILAAAEASARRLGLPEEVDAGGALRRAA